MRCISGLWNSSRQSDNYVNVDRLNYSSIKSEDQIEIDMLTKTEAASLLQGWLDTLDLGDDTAIIVGENTIERPFGCVLLSVEEVSRDSRCTLQVGWKWPGLCQQNNWTNYPVCKQWRRSIAY